MFDTVHTLELPRALQHLLSRSGTPDDGATVSPTPILPLLPPPLPMNRSGVLTELALFSLEFTNEL